MHSGAACKASSVRRFLGRVSEWSVTHTTQTIAAVIAIVAIIGTIGALRLTPDAGTDKLVDNGSSRIRGHAGVPRPLRRRGDRRARQEDLEKLVLTPGPVPAAQARGLPLRQRACRPTASSSFPEVCERDPGPRRDPRRLRPGDLPQPGGRRASQVFTGAIGSTMSNAQQAAASRPSRRRSRASATASSRPPQAGPAGCDRRSDLRSTATWPRRLGELGGAPDLNNAQFVSQIVFDSRQPGHVPKSQVRLPLPLHRRRPRLDPAAARHR